MPDVVFYSCKIIEDTLNCICKPDEYVKIILNKRHIEDTEPLLDVKIDSSCAC